MQPNVGGADRRARLAGGGALVAVAAALYAGLLGAGIGPFPAAGVALASLLVGAQLLVTATLRRCPVNAAAGVDTADQNS